MKTVTLHAEIGEDGTLRLEVPCGLPPGPAEVVVVVKRPEDDAAGPLGSPHRARSGLFLGRARPDALEGMVLDEMNASWKAKLSDL